MFSFVLWNGTVQTNPPHKAKDMTTATLIANNFAKTNWKVQILQNDKVVKELVNPTLEA